jgi:hypothetical protein
LLLALPPFATALHTASSVFIAYRRSGRETALATHLQRALKNEGHEAFIDLDLDVGDEWATRLRKTLLRSQVFVPILTEESVESPMLVNEIKTAYRQGRYTGRPIILPIRDPAVGSLPFELETYLGQLQYAEWSGEAQTVDTARAIVDAVTKQVANLPQTPVTVPPVSTLPSSDAPVRIRAASNALPLSDPLYVSRAGDADAFDRLDEDKFTLSILAPSGFGKTSLAIRLRKRCADLGRESATIDFQGFGKLPADDDGVRSGYVSFLNDFARAFCRCLKRQAPTHPIEDPQDIEALVRSALETMPRLVVVLDGADRLMTRGYGLEFFRLCRSWLDDTTMQGSFVFCISTEPSFFIQDINSSPFNVDRSPIELPPFDLRVLRALLGQARLTLSEASLEVITTVTGGHPLLTRQALVHVFGAGMHAREGAPHSSRGEDVVRARLEDLEARCGDINGGPFSASLRTLLATLEKPKAAPLPLDVLKKVVKLGKGFRPSADEERTLRRLIALGLVRQVPDVRPRYEMLNLAYARFISQRP